MKYILLFTLLFINITTNAQVVIKGKITDSKHKPLAEANVSLGETYDGASSDSLGNFSFTTLEKGKQNIYITLNGYKNTFVALNLDSTQYFINVILKTKINEMQAITVTAGAFEASDEKRGTVLKSLDIVTTAGSNGDLNGAFKTLPGTQQINDKDGLFVRGGTGYETQTFIDGTLVRNPFLSGVPDLGSRGRFNPFLFKGTTFSAGGYSALYGQALSSAIILETDDMPDKSQGFANLSGLGIGAGLLKVNKHKTQSFSISFNHTNLTPYFKLVKQNITYVQAPIYNQLDLSYRKKIGKKGLLKFYGYGNTSNLNINKNDIDSYVATTNNYLYKNEFKLNNNNLYLNVSFKDWLNKNWKINTGVCFSNNTDNITTKSLTQNDLQNTDSMYQYKNNVMQNNNQLLTGKVVLQRNFEGLSTIRFGMEQINYLDKQDLKTYSLNYKLVDQYSALFAESDIYITNNLVGKIGVRSEHSSLLNKWNIAPRVSIAYKIHPKGLLGFAYGDFYEKPENRFLYANANLQFMKATHYIFNYLYQTKDYLLRVEAYHKQYDNLTKSNFSVNNYLPLNATNDGTGYARGLEFFWRDKKTLPGLDYWISYSYIDSKRNYNSYLRSTQPDFVASNVASLVVKKFWVKQMFGINGTYTYSSGRPYLNYNKTNPYSSNNDANLFLSDYTSAFHNISVSCNYLKSIKKTFNVFVLSINNPFGFNQVYGYNYSAIAKNTDGSFYRQAITPAAKTFFFIGWFMSWGVDKSDDAINNNL